MPITTFSEVVLKKLLDRNMSGTINLLSDTVKVMLLSAAYTPNPAHEFVSSINAWELSGVGYVPGFGGAGRKTLAGKVFTIDTVNHKVFFDCDDVTWTAFNAGTAARLALIKEVTADSNSLWICTINHTPIGGEGTDLKWTVPAAGVFSIPVG